MSSEHNEERERLEAEARGLSAFLSNGWADTVNRMSRSRIRHEEIMETLAALDADDRAAAEAESHYDSSTTTAPVTPAVSDSVLDVDIPYLIQKVKRLAKSHPKEWLRGEIDAKLRRSLSVCADSLSVLLAAYSPGVDRDGH